MKKQRQKPTNGSDMQLQNRRHLNPAGTVLVYVVVLMLIFGILGVVMVSLFSSSIASSITRNDTRRALYMAESGMRYAFSELRNNDFDPDVIDTLNTTTYTLNSPGSFTINVFGPWFESPSNQSLNSTPLTLSVPQGELPENYAVPDNLWVINFEYTGSDTDETYMRSRISNYAKIDNTTLSLDVDGDFNAAEDDRVCLGVQPAFTQNTLSEGDDIVVQAIAKDFFPAFGGAININRVDYSYERLVEEGGQVKLKNISVSGFRNTLPAFPLTVEKTSDGGGTYTGEFIVLSPRNNTVVPTGTSDLVSHGGDVEFGLNIYDYSLVRPVSLKPDITADDLTSNLSDQETDTRFFETDEDADTLTIGGGGVGQFGSAFYAGDKSIGGDQDYCQQGACLFALGVRAYFLLDFTSQGDGITFTLINGANNRESSAGGDFQLSELMGYAGDSRLDAAGTSHLATAEIDQGLDPPKLAVEFDTRVNNDTLAYCSGASVIENTRDDDDPINEPDLINQDAVQYVFWGSEVLDLLCRSGSDNSTYDDNRHGPGFWQFDNPAGKVKSSPAVDPGRDMIYVGSNDNKLYAINSNGSLEWAFTTGGDVISSPAVGSDGTIYVGSNDNRVYAIRPDGTQKWQFVTGGDVRSSPAIASDGTIYIGSDDGNMYAFDPTGTPKPGWPFNAGVAFSLGRPAIGPDGTIYFSAFDQLLHARNPDGSEKWTVALGPIGNPGSNNDYMPGVDPVTGRVYTDVAGNAVAALNPATGIEIWRVVVNSDFDSTPIVGPDGTIYFGTDNEQSLFAVNPDGTVKWQFATGDEVDNTPALSPDGSVVYVVSNDGYVYAVDTDSGAENWSFEIVTDTGDSPANVTSSSVVNPNTGTIYVGSDDTSVYALAPFEEEPQNLQGLLLTNADLGALVGSEIDWLNSAASRGPWAVRLEVDRSTLPGGEGDYELRLWMKQCINAACDNINTADDPFPTDDPFFKDTRIIYQLSPPNLVQFFQLDALDNASFDRFLFGFTAAAGADPLDVTIESFTLSFSRPGDPVIDLPEF
jgi:outer membrane protein assembly factor BamB